MNTSTNTYHYERIKTRKQVKWYMNRPEIFKLALLKYVSWACAVTFPTYTLFVLVRTCIIHKRIVCRKVEISMKRSIIVLFLYFHSAKTSIKYSVYYRTKISISFENITTLKIHELELYFVVAHFVECYLTWIVI